jgi:outer membrane biosynthesis protein TonB
VNLKKSKIIIFSVDVSQQPDNFSPATTNIIPNTMIETLLQELTQALKDNTAAINSMLAAGETKPEKPAAAPKKAKAVVTEPEPEPEPEPQPEPVTNTTPTKVAVIKIADDTPSVPSTTPLQPGQPIAGDHVDVDEVLAQINTIVKGKLMSGDTASMKTKWEQIRKGKYGVDRMSDLKNDPAKLLAALADAKAL